MSVEMFDVPFTGVFDLSEEQREAFQMQAENFVRELISSRDMDCYSHFEMVPIVRVTIHYGTKRNTSEDKIPGFAIPKE